MIVFIQKKSFLFLLSWASIFLEITLKIIFFEFLNTLSLLLALSHHLSLKFFKICYFLWKKRTISLPKWQIIKKIRSGPNLKLFDLEFID